MRKKGFILCIILSSILLLSACAKSSTNSAAGSMKVSPEQSKQDMSNKASFNSSSQTTSTADKASNENSVITDQKIIRNGTINIVEEDLTKLAENIDQKAKELGGYIESEDMAEYRLVVKVRIPADKFEDFIKYTENGYDVKNKNISSENITDAYVDNEARLNNLKAQEKQILSILEKAKTVEEVLKVQGELYKVRGEAEALEARKKSWDKQVDYATLLINVDKKQIVSDNKKSIIAGSEFLRAAVKGFINTAVSFILFLQHLLIFIFSNIIIIAILGVIGVIGFKKYKKYNNNNKN